MKKFRGITLIALIVTIIILLILAGVTIASLGGENGLIVKVSQAKKAQIKTEMKEQLVLALNELQLDKKGKATLDDVTQEWAGSILKDYDPTITSDASISGKKVTMSKSEIISKYIIDENLNITEIEQSDSNIEFSYDVLERIDNKVSILIHVRDRENGLKTIKFPDKEDPMVIVDNKKEEKGIDYKVEIGTEYKIEITSESGEVREETILIADYWHTITKNLDEGISIDNLAVKAAYNKPYTATLTTGNSYIIDTITVTMDGTDVTSTVYDATTGTINIEKVTGDIEITATAIKLEIETTTPTVNTSNSTSVTTSIAANSVEKGTTLYINFSATLKGISGGTFTIKYNESEITMPYEVTKNGKYIFTVTGIYQGKTTEPKEVEVTVNQYMAAQNLVQYDAGEWTEDEINSLKALDLYNINESKTTSSESGLNFTFGGFTYKEDTENASYINDGTIVTSRNQSVKPQSGYGTPKYDGWQILEIKDKDENIITYETEINNKINNKTKDEKIYVTKLVHAGSPENFVYYYTTSNDSYRAEYILSGGIRQTTYNTYKARNWSMYKDKNLDAKGMITDVHAMKYDEALAMAVSSSTTGGLRKTGASYLIARASDNHYFWGVRTDGSMGSNFGSYICFGIRPVVELNEGVYIASGSGIEGDPYVLAMEEKE